MKRIAIIGSGLAGALLALYMARRGYEVELYESRPDLRKEKVEQGRSINLALSCRGMTGLAKIGLLPDVENIMVPMRARAIHGLQDEVKYQAFGRHKDEYINAILRNELNELLLNKADEAPNIHLHFELKLVDIDIHNKLLHFEDGKGYTITKPYERLIGADGAASNVREALAEKKLISFSRDFLPHGYKELSISKSHSRTLVREHLHLWPRGAFMLLGNPNRDDSITGSLFLPNEGENSFAELNTEKTINSFFENFFPDAYSLMPDLLSEFLTHPTGHLSTIKCSPWYFEDQCLLIGDAAHGVVPFFGQGMNSAFEDCRVLDELLDQYQDDWKQVMPAFYEVRKPDTDAVALMSMDNYHEIQSDIRDPEFNLKKQAEQELMRRYPERYISKHVLVMFSNRPYALAQAHGELQTELLNEICENVESIEKINWEKVDKLMNGYDKKLANLNLSEKNH